MRELLKSTGIEKFFARIGDAPLVLLTMASVALMGIDLLVWDPIPILDEAFLFLAMMGGTSEMARRFRVRRRVGGPTKEDGDTITIRRPASELKSLPSRVQVVVDLASRLVGGGAAPQVGIRMRELASASRAMTDELRDHEGFLARRDNDPYQVERHIKKLEKSSVALELEGGSRKLDVARKALSVARGHRTTIDWRIQQRDRLLTEMESLSLQVDSLTEDMRDLVAGKHSGDFAVRRLGQLDPRVESVIEVLQESHAAETEVEDALRRRRRPTAAMSF